MEGNLCSLALSINYNGLKALIGGDVFACEKPYHFINLPHHSSASAYCPKMWKEGMDKGGPIATTTIFRCSNGEDLPTREMLNLYKDRCKALFITNSDGDDEKTIAEEFDGVEGVEVIDRIIEKSGVIVNRWRSSEEGWITYCIGEAKEVDNRYMEKYHA